MTLIAFAPVLLEQLLLFFHPQWLARLAFLDLVAERRFRLPSTSQTPNRTVGYRDRAAIEAPLPIVPSYADLGDAVLFADERAGGYALRRAFGFINRYLWVVRIIVTQSGDEVRLHAREAVVGLSLPLATPFLFVQSDFLPTALIASSFFTAILALSFIVYRSFYGATRDAAIHRAYARIEEAMRQAVGA